MLDYDNMVKALRLSWLKRIVDPDYVGFWKSYLDLLLVNEGGLFLIQCNYDINRLTISILLSRTIRLVVKIKRSQGSRKYMQVYFMGFRIEQLQLLSMDRSKAISSTETACSCAQLREYP